MANIGISNASYYTDASMSRLKRQVETSVEKISSNKSNITNGEKTSLVSMDNFFRLDLAATNAAVKNMTLGQAYLSTAISTLDSASAILSEIHQLAVLGANGSNSDADNAAINMEAEALADAFHKSMTAAQFKGKAIFGENPSDSVMAAGGRSKEVQIGIEKIEYDFFYDYENPALITPDAGIKYEIRRALTSEEITSLLLRDPTLNASALIPGFQFILPEGSNNIGSGSIEVLNASGNVTSYNRGQGNLQIDPAAVATVEGDFRGGFLDIAVSKNFESADRLNLQDINYADGSEKIRIDANNVISFTFDDPNDDPDMGIITVEVGEIDTTSDGTSGLLRINLYGDATTPGSGNLLNGDFESGTRTQFGAPYEVYSASGFEHRTGMVDTFAIQTAGTGYVALNDTLSTGLARGSNTYSISFDSTGAGTGFRANVIVAGDGSLSIGEVLDKGKGYAPGEILTITQDARGTALAGNDDFSISVTTTVDSNDHDPGRDAANIHEVTEANFETVDALVANGPDGRYAWGQSFVQGTPQRIATNDGTGDITNYIHAVAGNYAVDAVTIDGVAQPLFTDVYDNDDAAAAVLIVDNFNPVFAPDDAILEQVSVADYVANTGGNNNSTETAIYELDPATGARVTTNWTFAEYTAGLADGSITSQGVADTQQLSGVTNILAAAYDGGGPQYIDTPNYGGAVDIIAVGSEQPGDNPVYNRETTNGAYAWGGGTFNIGDIVKDPAGADITRNIRHDAAGAYAFDITGSDFNPADLNYNANDEVLEFVAWANQFDPDSPPAGTTVYRSDNELEAPMFFTRSAGTVSYSNSISHYERPVITDYDRQEILGYERDEIAFYTRNVQLRTKENTAGQVEKYIGETRITNNPDGSVIRAHVGWDRDDQVFINNWTTYDDRVEFGSSFQITDTANGTLINSDLALGTFTDNSIVRNIPTPKIEDMAEPDYGAFVQMSGAPGNAAIQNRDDAATVPVVQNGAGEDIRDYSDPATPDVSVGLISGADVVDPFSGSALELFTGEIDFEDNMGFGIYHGPAVVSDQFRAEAGQFLRLNYTAAGDVDDYHVAGYIYEVDAVTGNPILDASGDAKITMALTETGTAQPNGRASVEIEEGGDYRFVFIVGTFDKTGGLAAGASMKIDNIVAEFPYSISDQAVEALLQSVNYRTDASMAISGTKTITSTLRNSDDSHLLTDDAIIKMEGFELTDQSDGPFMLAPTLNLETTPSEGSTGNASVLTSKIETVQELLNIARVQAGSQYAALEEAINVSTDLRSQFALGSGTLSDLNFSMETVNLTRRQMQQDVATTVLTQANKTQSSLVSLVDGSYRTYLNAQFSHLK